MDLSVISEKEDNNTSISFMGKENKIRNFIISAIHDIKNISKEKSNKKFIPQNENKDLMKKTFFMTRKNNHKDMIKVETEDILTKELEVFMDNMNNSCLKMTNDDYDDYSGLKCHEEPPLFQNCEEIIENTELCLNKANENQEKISSLLNDSQNDSSKIIDEKINQIKIYEEILPGNKSIEENFENMLSVENCNKEGMITNGIEDIENNIEFQAQIVCGDQIDNEAIIDDSISLMENFPYKMISKVDDDISREAASKILDGKNINSSSDNEKICVYVQKNQKHSQFLSFPCMKSPQRFLLITFMAMYKFPLFFNLKKQLEIKIKFC